MSRVFTYDQLGKPSVSGVMVAFDGTQVNIEQDQFDMWKADGFRSMLEAKLIVASNVPGPYVWTAISLV